MNSAELKQLADLITNYCTPAWQEILFQSAVLLEYKPGEIIFKEGQKADSVYMVKEGRIKVFSNFTEKIEIIARFSSDGQVIGHRGFGENFTFSVSAKSLSRSSIYIFPIEVFQNMLMANNMFCYYFLLFFAEELRRTERMQKNLLNMSVKQRVAMAIKINQESFGYRKGEQGLFAFTLSKKDLAFLANTSYESVVRTLKEFEKEAVIQLEGKQIRLLDEAALLAYGLPIL